MNRALLLLAIFMVTWCDVKSHDDDTYSENIQEPVDSVDVSDGTDAISRFLGFKCPKGHRCLPVLECLPCDYGTYKADEGSDLCETCPSGCTTLRKGAESKRECVPKCPPGYEESECGKTCTKCRAGFYKSNWKNKKCNKCPLRSIWNKNMVGMKKRKQCFYDNSPEPTTPKPTEPEDQVTTGCMLNDPCTAYDYTVTRLTLLHGSNCTKFCQCAHAEGSAGDEVYYKWVEHDCPAGTLFDTSLDVPVCNHANEVQCSEGYSPSKTTSSPPSPPPEEEGMGGCVVNDVCTLNDYEDVRLKPLYGSICEKFCQCAYAEGSAGEKLYYYWEEHDCAPGTLFDADLKVCDHEANVQCQDASIPSQTTVSPPDDNFPGDGCVVGDACTLNEYEVLRLKPLYGSNCEKFCQCAYAEGSAGEELYYYWEEHDCAPGTLFDADLKVCDHEANVQCQDTYMTPVPATDGEVYLTTVKPVITTEEEDLPEIASPSGLDWCVLSDPCSKEEYENVRLRLLFGTECTKFCHCAHAAGSAGTNVSYYWEEQTCAEGTLFDVHLEVPVCNHWYDVKCSTCPLYSADIVFVIDSSGSIGDEDFAKQIDFVNSIIDAFDFNDTRFAALTFSSDVNQVIPFDDAHEKSDLQQLINQLVYASGGTNTAGALEYVKEDILGSTGNRPEAADIVIVLTDGVSNDVGATQFFAQELHKAAHMVLSVGIGDANMAELQTIASDVGYVFYALTFDLLDTLKTDLQRTTCGVGRS